MREKKILNQCAFTVEVHTQPKNALNKIKKERAIRNHPLIHRNIIISVMNVTYGNQIRASDVDWSITPLQIFLNWTLCIRKFTGTQKILKLIRTDIIKYIRHQKTVQMKASHRRYTRLWHVFLIT